jgi:hypothetical protein
MRTTATGRDRCGSGCWQSGEIQVLQDGPWLQVRGTVLSKDNQELGEREALIRPASVGLWLRKGTYRAMSTYLGAGPLDGTRPSALVAAHRN